MKSTTLHHLPTLTLTALLGCAAVSSTAFGAGQGRRAPERPNYYQSLYYRGGYSYYDKGPAYRFLFYSDPGYTPYFPYSPGLAAIVNRPFQPREARNVEAEVQLRLAKKGFYRGVIDGVVGIETRQAIRAYQMAHSLPVTGRMDYPLLKSLRVI